jgi:hypothetical protein
MMKSKLKEQLELQDKEYNLLKDFLKIYKNNKKAFEKIHKDERLKNSLLVYDWNKSNINVLLNTVFNNRKLVLKIPKYDDNAISKLLNDDFNNNNKSNKRKKNNETTNSSHLRTETYNKFYNIINDVDEAINLTKTTETIKIYTDTIDKKSKKISNYDGYLSGTLALGKIDFYSNNLSYVTEIEIPPNSNLLSLHFGEHKNILKESTKYNQMEFLLPRGAQLSFVSEKKIEINSMKPHWHNINTDWYDINNKLKKNIILLKYKFIGVDKKEVPKTYDNIELKILQ